MKPPLKSSKNPKIARGGGSLLAEKSIQKLLLNRFKHAKEDFHLVENSFSSAANFFWAVENWIDNTNSQQTLTYSLFESQQQIKATLDKLSAQEQDLLNISFFLLPGRHQTSLFNGRIQLIIWVGEPITNLKQQTKKVDAWLLNRTTKGTDDKWIKEFVNQMVQLSQPKALYINESDENAKIKTLLIKKGVSATENFGEYIHPRSFTESKPWFSSPVKINDGLAKTACVIGAGLAGASVAYKLASEGWKVTVLEAEPLPATQASGNLAGAIHPLVTADWNIRSQFYQAGYESTLNWLEDWLEAEEIIGDLSGLIQLAMDEKMQQRLQRAIKQVDIPPEFANWCSPEEASELIGLKTDFPGLFFSKAGWVNPLSVVKRCLAHKNIQVIYQQTVQELKQCPNDSSWKISTKESLQQVASVLIVATGSLNTKLNQQLNLPIRPVKGQVNHFDNNTPSKTLKTTVTHQGYSVSNIKINGQSMAVSGATFEAPNLSATGSKEATETNLDMASKALPNWINKPARLEKNPYKVGFRPTTPDHLPLIGAVVNADHAAQAYYQRSHTHAVFRYPNQQYQTGLFVSNGHGARGLMSVFLAAEIIYAQITNKTSPIAKNIDNAIHLERFKVRNWRNGKEF